MSVGANWREWEHALLSPLARVSTRFACPLHRYGYLIITTKNTSSLVRSGEGGLAHVIPEWHVPELCAIAGLEGIYLTPGAVVKLGIENTIL